VIRRTIATLAQKKGTVKDVQGLLRHSRAATTTDVYMQEIPESVQGYDQRHLRRAEPEVQNSVSWINVFEICYQMRKRGFSKLLI
jgi:integrase